METELRKILLETYKGQKENNDEAVERILLLFDVSCQCDSCKQDKFDSNYRKYIELNKNVIGYD